MLNEKLEAVLGEKGLVSGDALAERLIPHGHPGVLLRPQSTDEVAAALRLCNEAGQPVVPYGGLTGLVEATTANGSEVAISLERMNAIEEIDIASRTMTVQAGVPLQVVQEAAEAEGLLFPLDIGARGSATIGGQRRYQRRRQSSHSLRHDAGSNPRHGSRTRGWHGPVIHEQDY